MQRDLSPTIGLLSEILQKQEALLALSEEKRETLVTSKAEKLSEIGGKEMALLSEINNLEKQRVQSLGEVAMVLGKTPRTVTMADLLKCAGDTQRAQLEELQKGILAAAKAQNDINQLNQTLLEAHIEYTEIMLGAFVGPDDDFTQYYDRAGNADLDTGAVKPGLFDTQA